MKKNNKIFVVFIGLFVIIVLFFILFNCFNKSNLIELSVNDVIEKVNNKDSFVLCISRTDCSHCRSYKPKLEKISKEYDINIYYIDIDKYTKEQQSEFKKVISFDGSTPVTAFIVDGDETTSSNRIFGNLSNKKIIEKLEKHGFIEKK